MAWFRVWLTEEQQQIVNEERTSHPDLRSVRRCWSFGYSTVGPLGRRPPIVGLGRATVHRYVVAFREGGLDGLRRCDRHRPVSEMAAYRELIRESFEKQPARTMAEACDRIFQLYRAWSGLRHSHEVQDRVTLWEKQGGSPS